MKSKFSFFILVLVYILKTSSFQGKMALKRDKSILYFCHFCHFIHMQNTLISGQNDPQMRQIDFSIFIFFNFIHTKFATYSCKYHAFGNIFKDILH